MKKNILILVVAISLLAGAGVLLKNKTTDLPAKKEAVDTVFLGPKEYQPTFEESMASGGQFYDLYGKARESIKVKDYDGAINFLNASLQHVGIGFEKGMVYRKLAEIYRLQGNDERELFYLEEWPKYSMNKELNQEAVRRAQELRQKVNPPADQQQP